MDTRTIKRDKGAKLSEDELKMLRQTLVKQEERLRKQGAAYVICNKIIPTINCLIRTLEKLDITHEISERLHKNVLLELQNRFRGKDSNIETNSFLSIYLLTLLDTRFKKLHFSSSLAVSTAISKISQLMKNNRGKGGLALRRAEVDKIMQANKWDKFTNISGPYMAASSMLTRWERMEEDERACLMNSANPSSQTIPEMTFTGDLSET
ncbi:hypothetical protein ALC62_11611 [Cyphomyrmex costatus]|uniref:Uncharacterized protein n=1 Tax=Cyphomyrmex costatus TaxID=456900 RepID=A0A151ICE3_9HYME|nr:hypothetical protein ALC62_11611 [Cyphomyrmex costatus]